MAGIRKHLVSGVLKIIYTSTLSSDVQRASSEIAFTAINTLHICVNLCL
jgi:hypothetical protein